MQTLRKQFLQGNELPQDLLVRVALQVASQKHFFANFGTSNNVEVAMHYVYPMLKEHDAIFATPTLINACLNKPQLSSCFLLGLEDSIDGMCSTLWDCAKISKAAGGIGVHFHNIRAEQSKIGNAPARAAGSPAFARLFNETAKIVDQEGKRPGSIAAYIGIEHADFPQMLHMRSALPPIDKRTYSLFFAAWIPDLFMERLDKNEDWSLFSPDEAPGLHDAVGEDFKQLYEQYEREGRQRFTVKAQALWKQIVAMQSDSGMPFILFKDACNRKSNQKNLGTIKSSNLYTEIVQYSDSSETAVCNLASISLPNHYDVGNDRINKGKLDLTVRILVRCLNTVINCNWYPTEKAKTSNRRHRPVGIGVQGLATMLTKARVPFDSDRAMQLNRKLFERIYYSALDESCALA
jgi:ribonucleoside-diphosphate reductase alpha subunit